MKIPAHPLLDQRALNALLALNTLGDNDHAHRAFDAMPELNRICRAASDLRSGITPGTPTRDEINELVEVTFALASALIEARDHAAYAAETVIAYTIEGAPKIGKERGRVMRRVAERLVLIAEGVTPEPIRYQSDRPAAARKRLNDAIATYGDAE